MKNDFKEFITEAEDNTPDPKELSKFLKSLKIGSFELKTDLPKYGTRAVLNNTKVLNVPVLEKLMKTPKELGFRNITSGDKGLLELQFITGNKPFAKVSM